MKFQNVKGTRDFYPQDMAVRNWLTDLWRRVSRRHGFVEYDGPTFEYLDLYKAKSGEGIVSELFHFEDRGGRRVALPYDQTVPTARVLSQYRRDLPRYFRRYAVGNVFRAENPQKGRYREFRQCDIDVFGSTDPLADAEIVACTYCAFRNVGYPEVRIRINDRRSLVTALEPFATEQADVFSIIRSMYASLGSSLRQMNSSLYARAMLSKGSSGSRASNTQLLQYVEATTAVPSSMNCTAKLLSLPHIGIPSQ